MSSGPRLEFAFELQVTVALPMELGPTAGGRRRVIPITGGTFQGPRLSGRIVPGGADWQVVREDGMAELTARYTIEAADGTLIGVLNRGIRRGPPEVLRKLAAGEPVDPSSYYFRTAFQFEPPDGPHAWLSQSIFVGAGERRAAAVLIRVFELV